MTNDDVLVVEGFEKTFTPGLMKKPVQAAKGVSFTAKAGEILGFLGPNGAGKTTTIKASLGLIRPTGGTIRILGEPPESMGWRRRVGYMPEHPSLFEFLTGQETVEWFGQLAGMRGAALSKQAASLLDRVGLGHAKSRRLRTYSKGMLQRIAMAQAMLGKPQLLVLDEPMSGLDPIGRRELREIILQLREEGSSVMFSTHILPDVEMTCDRVVIIEGGKTRYEGPVDGALGGSEHKVVVTVSGLKPARQRELVAERGAVVEGDKTAVVLPTEAEARTFLSALLVDGAQLERFEPQRESLESVFMRSLGEQADPDGGAGGSGTSAAAQGAGSADAAGSGAAGGETTAAASANMSATASGNASAAADNPSNAVASAAGGDSNAVASSAGGDSNAAAGAAGGAARSKAAAKDEAGPAMPAVIETAAAREDDEEGKR